MRATAMGQPKATVVKSVVKCQQRRFHNDGKRL